MRGNRNVLLLENIHEAAADALDVEGFEVVRMEGSLSEEELCERLSDVHILGIRSKSQITRAVLERATSLLAVGCFCIGTNQVDLTTANGLGIPVFNAPFSNTRSVAELVLGEIIVLARQLGDRSCEMHAGKWRKVSRRCHEVRGKKLGIIGYGHIGTQVGVAAEAIGMKVAYYDTAIKQPMGNNRAITSLGRLLEQSDFVTLHVPATEQTVGMIGANELAHMRQGAYLLNASRGNVVHIPALADALRSGHLAGAAIDVFPSEPAANSDDFVSELRGLPNVILTPHIGGSTEEAQEAIGHEVSSSLIRFLMAGTTASAVNFPALDAPLVPGTHRIINVHKNVPGVLGRITGIVSGQGVNIASQHLATDANIGYLLMDIENGLAQEVRDEIARLDTSIRTYVLS